MPEKCIFNCRGSKRFFGFPQVCPKRMKIWADILDLDPSKIMKNHRLCEKHFQAKHMGKKFLVLDAVPQKRVAEAAPPPKTSAGPAVQVECSSDDTRFETIYLIPKKQQVRTCQSPYTPQIIQETTEECISTPISNEVNQDSEDENLSQFEPVDTAFKAPPKRTYGHSNNFYTKTPKLDITATCYCRCHKGEDEKIKLKQTIDEMKKTEAEQAREINLLISKNKVSEHLLKGKVKKITELMNLENTLRKAIEGLNTRISVMSKRQIKAAPNASENSIILARMICDRRKKYTKSEVIVANKLYAISGRCYYFMRDVLKLNLPHPTTLLRNRKIFSPVPEEHTIYKDFDEDPMEEEHEEPIVFSPEPIQEQQEEELQLEVDF